MGSEMCIRDRYFSRNTRNLLFLIADLDSADSKLQYAYKYLYRRKKLQELPNCGGQLDTNDGGWPMAGKWLVMMIEQKSFLNLKCKLT